MLCPSGWHLPSRGEWQVLVEFAGGDKTAGKKLKTTIGWDSKGNGTDVFGFSALSGGQGKPDGSFSNSYYGLWWSASEYNYDSSKYYYVKMDYSNESVYLGPNQGSELLSVRCLQD